jgi:multidrug efflux pump subunit AcrB
VGDVLTLTGNPFDRLAHGFSNRACVLVNLAGVGQEKGDREKIAGAIRARLGEIQEMRLRLRDLSAPGRFPWYGYPIHLAIEGPEENRVRELAGIVVKRLHESKQLTDLWSSQDDMAPPGISLEIDRAEAARQGVGLGEIHKALGAGFGSIQVNDFNLFGRAWQMYVQTEAPFRDMKKLNVPNEKGDPVPLANLVKARVIEGPATVGRIDSQQVVEITANPAPGVSLAQARKLCESVMEEARDELRLPPAYQLKWLRELP